MPRSSPFHRFVSLRGPVSLRRAAAVTVAALLAAAFSISHAAEDEPDDPLPKDSGKPKHFVAPASDEAANAMKSFKLPAGWKVDLFAAEPSVANPVCLSLDDRGRVYVVETFRRRNAVLDIRKINSWLDDDLASRTVEDRIAMVKRRLPNDWQKLTGITDRIRLVEDSDGDGVADKATVFAEKFDNLEDGTAAGVLPVGDSVYFTNIPHLWKLRDTNGDGVADERVAMHSGFGVRYNYSGHDFHGLKMGPDGRLYFSIADRGFHVEENGKVLASGPDEGAVLRCEPDGSNLEVVHRGLRNPQELAFDEFGNLFTGDNNSDGGDPTRWVHVVEGGDSGWHIGWQWLGGSTPRGPWISEDLCQVETRIPVYYRLPPVATPKIAGPAGLTYAPGTGLPAEWNGRFYLVDFRGGPAGGSGIYALKNKPKGASFELEDVKELVTNVLPTDVDFGPDGRMYFTDWVTGWEPHGKGRVYAITPPGLADDKLAAEVKRVLADGFKQRREEELVKLLAHADMRLRQGAQFELTTRAEKGVVAFTSIATDTAATPLARLHAIWGLGQVARSQPRGSAADLAAVHAAGKTIRSLVADSDAEVRAQACKVAGEAAANSEVRNIDLAALGRLVTNDRSARVRYFATMALGRLGKPEHAKAVFAMLKKNSDQDAYLRHAGVMAIAALADDEVLSAASEDSSGAIRVAALLACRREAKWQPRIATFLKDPDPTLVLEAARAVNDLPIAPALPQLAKLADEKGLIEPLMRRALNANHRLGEPANAKRLADCAARSDLSPAIRIEAIEMLAEWPTPSGRDRITGLWRPAGKKDVDAAVSALKAKLDGLLHDAPDTVRVAALNAGLALKITTTPLFELATAEKNPAGLRSAAMAAMAQRNDAKLADAAKLAIASNDETLRIAAIRVQPMVPGGADQLTSVLANGSPQQQQAVVQTAAVAAGGKDKARAKIGDELLSLAFGRLEAGTLPVEAQLDLLDAVAKKKTGALADRLKKFDAARQKKLAADPLALHRETLAGGDAARGQMIFRDRADVSCMRCHAINTVGGNAGPDLAGTLARNGGGTAGREYLLEAILHPSKKIAPGWESVSLHTASGDVVAGVLKAEDEKTITLEVPNAGVVKVEKANVRKRQGGLSAMPDDIGKTLSKQDLRDLVEFLAGQ